MKSKSSIIRPKRLMLHEDIYNPMMESARYTYQTGVERGYYASSFTLDGSDLYVDCIARTGSSIPPEVKRIENGFDMTGKTAATTFHSHPMLPFSIQSYIVSTDGLEFGPDPVIVASMMNDNFPRNSNHDWLNSKSRNVTGVFCYLGKDVMTFQCYYNDGRVVEEIPVYRYKNNNAVRVPSRISGDMVGDLFDVYEIQSGMMAPLVYSSGKSESWWSDGQEKTGIESIGDYRILSMLGQIARVYLPVAKDLDGQPIGSPISQLCGTYLYSEKNEASYLGLPSKDPIGLLKLWGKRFRSAF